MVDPCILHFCFRNSDRAQFADMLAINECEEDAQDDGSVEAAAYAVDGGFNDDWEKFADSGVTFYGYHSQGAYYGEYLFAAFDGQVAYVPCYDTLPCVGVQEDMQLVAMELDSVRRYYELLEKAKEYIHGHG